MSGKIKAVIDESQLIKKIAALPDDDLLRMINAGSSEYRLEAIVYANAELRERGVVSDAAGLERTLTVKSAPASALKFLAVLTGRIATFTIGLIAGLFLFMLINYRTVEYPPFIDGCGHTGWPFRFYTFGGWAGISIINWPFLLVDALVGLIVGVGMAVLFTAIIGFVKSSLVE